MKRSASCLVVSSDDEDDDAAPEAKRARAEPARLTDPLLLPAEMRGEIRQWLGEEDRHCLRVCCRLLHREEEGRLPAIILPTEFQQPAKLRAWPTAPRNVFLKQYRRMVKEKSLALLLWPRCELHSSFNYMDGDVRHVNERVPQAIQDVVLKCNLGWVLLTYSGAFRFLNEYVLVANIMGVARWFHYNTYLTPRPVELPVPAHV
jgi:hypothetical protein